MEKTVCDGWSDKKSLGWMDRWMDGRTNEQDSLGWMHEKERQNIFQPKTRIDHESIREKIQLLLV